MKKPYTVIFTIAVFLLLIAGFLHPVTAFTQDLGRHLLMGKIILQTHTVPQTNLLSYTYPDFPFINTHWLSEVVFYIAQQLFGITGLLLITTAIVVTAFGLIFFSTVKKGNIFAVTIASLLYLRVLFERTDIRPELFSFLFLSIFIVILYKYRENYTHWIFLLPLLELIWVNMHIYFPIGIAVIGLFLIDYLIKNRKHLNHHYTSILVVIFISCGLMTCINPNGINGALYPLHVFQNYGYQIEENQTVFFLWNYFGGKTTILYFFISSTLLFLTLLLTVKKSRPIDWLLAIFFTYLAANAERNLPLFVFGTFIPCTYAASITIQKIPFTQKTNHLKQFAALLLIGVIAWNINDVIHVKSFGLGIAKGAERGADFFLANNLHGPLFNNFDIGSYIDYRLFPKEKVFIDGRPEAYPALFIQNEYIPMQSDPRVFEKEDQKYHFNVIFFSHTDMTPWGQTFLTRIIQDTQWKIVYLDDYVIILLKNVPENTNLINKFALTQTSFHNNIPEQADTFSLLRLANFFHLAGWQKQEVATYQQLASLDPNNCIALYSLATILSQHNNPAATMYAQHFQESCR